MTSTLGLKIIGIRKPFLFVKLAKKTENSFDHITSILALKIIGMTKPFLQVRLTKICRKL